MICLAWQATSFIVIALASSQIHDSVCQGKQNHRLCLPGRATKSMILCARASKIIDLCCPREPKNQCFGLPGHAKSLILHAKASTIIDFACPGELPNASCWLRWRGCCFGVGGRWLLSVVGWVAMGFPQAP